MLTRENVLALDKDDLAEAAQSLDQSDLAQLVEWLAEKDDAVRYAALLLLQQRSRHTDDVYPYWHRFSERLASENSYQRSIGLMLIADNAHWDHQNRLDGIIDSYLLLLNDEKPITVRQCLQALARIAADKPQLHQTIAQKVMSINLSEIRETMRKVTLLDILGVLAAIQRQQPNARIEAYIMEALQSPLLDKKARRQVEAMLQG